jgi:polysaccharide deacetylase 2 family uncharacterized protein YibQ
LPSPRRKIRTSASTASRRRSAWRWWLVGLLMVAAGALGLWTWLENPLGRAFLLRAGYDRVYGEVQQEVERALAEVLPGWPSLAIAGEAEQFPATSAATDPAAAPVRYEWSLPAAGRGAAVRARLVALDDARTFWEIEAEIQRAVSAVGARVLWGERIDRPQRGRSSSQPDEMRDLLRLDVGIPRRPTHTLLFYKSGAGAPQLRWGGGGASLWAILSGQEVQPTIALVIDDWGYYENDATHRLLALDVPLTLGVLPNLSYSRRFALEVTELAVPEPAPASGGPLDASLVDRRIRLRGQRHRLGLPVEFSLGRSWRRLPERRREVILHLPMEPVGYPEVDPGPGAILVGMSEEEMRRLVEAALVRLPAATGVSNHMGSRATADPETMERLMAVLASRGLFFLDSLTSSRSVAARAARQAGLQALESRLFLDQPEGNARQVRRRLEQLVSVARRRGAAVGIAHPYPETVAVLAEELPRLDEEGVRLVTLSELLALQKAGENGAAAP